MVKASVFIGTSVDGFIARANGDLDFYHRVVANPTATTNSCRQSTRW